MNSEILQSVNYGGYKIVTVRSKKRNGFKAIVSDAANRKHYYSNIYKTEQAAIAEAEEYVDSQNKNLPKIK